MKILIATMLGLLMMSMFSAHADDVAQPPKPHVLTMFPQFLEMVDNFNTRDACVEKGIELMNSAAIFNGFVCERHRAWIAADEVAVPTGWMPEGEES